MAHCLRRPGLSTSGLQTFTRIQQQTFTSTALRCAAPTPGSAQQPRLGSDRSLRLQAKEQQQQIATDMGLMPDTFIRPTGPNRPAFLSSPSQSLRLEYAYIKRTLQNLFGLLVYRFAADKPKPRLAFREVGPAAAALQQQMYRAFAAGNVRSLRRICADGILESFEARIAARGRGERWTWELVRGLGRPRVLSHRAATLGITGAGLRQAVVRIRSVQRLTRYVNGKIVPGSGKDKEVVENVVIQRRMLNGREEGWGVWGTVEETTLEKLEEMEEIKKAQLS